MLRALEEILVSTQLSTSWKGLRTSHELQLITDRPIVEVKEAKLQGDRLLVSFSSKGDAEGWVRKGVEVRF